jgi:hypothetical protein
MKKRFPWLRSKSFGSFFLVLMSCSFQNDIYKAQPIDFLHRLTSSSIFTICILTLMAIAISSLLCHDTSSSQSLEKLAKSPVTRVSYSALFKLHLTLILVSSSSQYLMHRNETRLNWWHFCLSATVAVSLGLLARCLASYLVNRRINAATQFQTSPHLSL